MNNATHSRTLTRDITVTGLLIAMGLLLPMIFHTFHMGGPVFLPMHIPVLICGLLVGSKYGLICGLVLPILSSALTGMPPMFPVAFIMTIELATYGFVSGLLHKKTNIYIALIGAQLIGRLLGALGSFAILGLAGKSFVLTAFLTGAFVTSLPGIVIQLALIPPAVLIIQKAGFKKQNG